MNSKHEAEWVPVEIRQPFKDGTYLCVWQCGSSIPYKAIRVGHYRKGRWNKVDWNYITHWLIPPSLPEEVNDE